jgi:hypothetical protein
MRTASVQSASTAQSALTPWSSLMLKYSSRVMNENEAATPEVAKDSALPFQLSVNSATCAGLTTRALEPPVPIANVCANKRDLGTTARGYAADASRSTTSPHAGVKFDENSILRGMSDLYACERRGARHAAHLQGRPAGDVHHCDCSRTTASCSMCPSNTNIVHHHG